MADRERCDTRHGWFTGQVICTACAPDCDHYLCTHENEEDES